MGWDLVSNFRGPAGVTLLRLLVAPRTYTNQGAGPTESNTADRALIDLTGRTNVRLLGHVSTAGVTAVWRAQYSLNGTTFADLGNTIPSSGATGLKASSLAAIPALAKALVLIRVVATGGNSTEDPVLNGVTLEVT